MFKRIINVTTLTFTLLMLAYLVIFNRVSFFPQNVIWYLLILSGIMGMLSYIYVGYTHSTIALVWRTIAHYLLLLVVLSVSIILFTVIPLWPLRIFWLWLLYTLVYAVFWVIIFTLGARSNRHLNDRLKHYQEQHRDE